MTYQDYLSHMASSGDVCAFIESAVRSHISSEIYKTAVTADRYYHMENPTIMKYQKLLYSLSGRALPDNWSPNNKIVSNWYFYFTTQAVGHLLGNGVFFENPDTRDCLGRDFDRKLVMLASEAKNGGMSFGFLNGSHIDVFTLRDFVPLFDAFTGRLAAGIRFVTLSEKLGGYFTFFEEDGYRNFAQSPGDEMKCVGEKTGYAQIPGKNGKHKAKKLPIVPLYNTLRQSDIAGNRYLIDAYDLMASGLVNNADEGNFIYWILKNCDGMNEADDAKFIEQLRRHHFAHADGDDNSGVESHVVETPFEAHSTALDRLERQLFVNFMAVDVHSIAAGNRTATEIRAAYEPLNAKNDLFEFEVIEFVDALLELCGLEDTPTFKRAQVANQLEDTEMILAAADYLDAEAVLKKLPWLSVDEADEILSRRKEGA